MENNFNLAVLTVFDKVTRRFGFPFVQVNESAGIRSFQDAMAADNNIHADDMQLCFIAEFSEATGRLSNIQSSPKVIAEGKDIVYYEED